MKYANPNGMAAKELKYVSYTIYIYIFKYILTRTTTREYSNLANHFELALFCAVSPFPHLRLLAARCSFLPPPLPLSILSVIRYNRSKAQTTIEAN